MKLHLLYVVVVLLCVSACSGSSSDNVHEPVNSLGVIPNSLDAASRVYRFDYSMPAVTGGTTIAHAQLFEPLGVAPDDGFPLVVWAHGTTGIANSCAPSISFELFGNSVVINGLLSAGYAVLAPDYEGFGTPTIHPYYQRASHANAVLAAIPAAHATEDSNFGCSMQKQ